MNKFAHFGAKNRQIRLETYLCGPSPKANSCHICLFLSRNQASLPSRILDGRLTMRERLKVANGSGPSVVVCSSRTSAQPMRCERTAQDFILRLPIATCAKGASINSRIHQRGSKVPSQRREEKLLNVRAGEASRSLPNVILILEKFGL